jgi:hypothetical protein
LQVKGYRVLNRDYLDCKTLLAIVLT